MIPWDFGIINSIKEKTNMEIFPSQPPVNMQSKPYLIFNIVEIRHSLQNKSRMEFNLEIHNNINNFEISKKLSSIFSKPLPLFYKDIDIGNAKIKINSLNCHKNTTILSVVAIVNLNMIYEDEENINDQ